MHLDLSTIGKLNDGKPNFEQNINFLKISNHLERSVLYVTT